MVQIQTIWCDGLIDVGIKLYKQRKEKKEKKKKEMLFQWCQEHAEKKELNMEKKKEFHLSAMDLFHLQFLELLARMNVQGLFTFSKNNF